MQPRILKTPLEIKEIKKLKIGEVVYLSGTIFTVRDRAHQRILKFIKEGKKLPFDLASGTIFHTGPIVKKNKNWKIMAIGPTTSSRLNSSTLQIISNFSPRAIIGKGGMSSEVSKVMKNTVYLASTGGCSALLTQQIKKVKGVYWLDLSSAEAVWELEVENFGPLVVGIDTLGNSLYAKIEAQVNKNLKKLLSKEK